MAQLTREPIEEHADLVRRYLAALEQALATHERNPDSRPAVDEVRSVANRFIQYADELHKMIEHALL